MVEGIERIIGVELIDRIRRIAGIVPVDRIERILRIDRVDGIQRIIRTVLIDRVEDIVIALVLRIEPLFGSLNLSFSPPTYPSPKNRVKGVDNGS